MSTCVDFRPLGRRILTSCLTPRRVIQSMGVFGTVILFCILLHPNIQSINKASRWLGPVQRWQHSSVDVIRQHGGRRNVPEVSTVRAKTEDSFHLKKVPPKDSELTEWSLQQKSSVNSTRVKSTSPPTMFDRAGERSMKIKSNNLHLRRNLSEVLRNPRKRYREREIHPSDIDLVLAYSQSKRINKVATTIKDTIVSDSSQVKSGFNNRQSVQNVSESNENFNGILNLPRTRNLFLTLVRSTGVKKTVSNNSLKSNEPKQNSTKEIKHTNNYGTDYVIRELSGNPVEQKTTKNISRRNSARKDRTRVETDGVRTTNAAGSRSNGGGGNGNWGQEREQGSPTLLWWTPMSGQRDSMARCGDVTCRVTVDRHDRQLASQSVKMYIFYGSNFRGTDLPLPRQQDELWALVHEESPQNNDFLFSHGAILELFNYTSTFRSHSSFPVPSQWLSDPKLLYDTTYVVPTEEKSRLQRAEGLAPVVYVQSDCRAPSDRDHFVRMLMQHVKVDSYGVCLHNKNLSDRLTFREGMRAMTSARFYKLLSRYKFAVAMENAVCQDYVTEKFWRPLQLGVVPIAFGSPSLKDFLPSKKSALLVSDLGSVKAVADVVRLLDSNDTLYDQYLTFKKHDITNTQLLRHLAQRSWGEGRSYKTHFAAFECFLCRQLHQDLANKSRGDHVRQSVASKHHYGCPRPRRFDNQGHYVEESHDWRMVWRWSRGRAMAIRHFHSLGVQPTASQLENAGHQMERLVTEEDLDEDFSLDT